MSSIKNNRFISFVSRAFALLLASAYLLFSVGILKATHFCMGREASVSYFTTEAKKCACSVYAEMDNCCDDEKELLKIEDEQKVIPQLTLSLPQMMVLEKLYTEQLLATSLQTDNDFIEADPSPPKIPLFKFHCSFVFYDDGLTA